MELDPEKFVADEKFSNHAVQGFSHPDCPIGKGCFGIATGFGGAFFKMCDHLRYTKTSADCDYITGSQSVDF